MHRDVYPDWETSTRILESCSTSAADPNSAIGSLYELDLLGALSQWVPEIPGYTELLLSTCARVGLDPSEFR